jgi:hypothetical protein
MPCVRLHKKKWDERRYHWRSGAFQYSINSEADTQSCTSKAVDPMSDRQVYGLTLLLLGFAVLIVSVGVAWMLARRSRAGRVESTWLITTVSFVLFVVGVALCWFGVSAIVEG